MTASTVIDLLVVFALVGYAVGGWRRGGVHSVTALAGFLVGAAAALWLVPVVMRSVPTRPREDALAMILVLTVVLAGGVGQAVGGMLGARLRHRLVAPTARRIDAGVGAVVSTLVVAAVMWFIAGTVRPALPPAASAALAQSRTLTLIDAHMPSSATQLFAGARNVLAQQGFPRVFTGLESEPIVSVEPPDAAVTAAPAIRDASRSVVKVHGDAAACHRDQEGSGWVLAPGKVVTNAHVVAGMSDPFVQVLGVGRNYKARVVAFAPGKDLAVLDVPGLPAPPLRTGGRLGAGSSAVVAGFPHDGPYTIVPARVRTVIAAAGQDIYGRDRVVRQVYSLLAKVEPGNSGGPLLAADGSVAGTVFARSLDDPLTGYALTLEESADTLRAAVNATEEVATGSCINGS